MRIIDQYLYRFESDPDYDDVPPNIFENVDGIVSKEPLFINYTMNNKVFVCPKYTGADFVRELKIFASIVYHDNTGQCAKDMIDKCLYCKFRATCEDYSKDKDNYEYKIPHYATSENLTKSNIFVRLHFPNKGTFESGKLVFEVGYQKYKTKYLPDALVVWNDIGESEFDLLETPLGDMEEISMSLLRAYHIDKRVIWRFQDYKPEHWNYYVDKHNAQFENAPRVERSTLTVSNTASRQKQKEKRSKSKNKNKNKTKRTTSNKANEKRSKSMVGSKRKLSEVSDNENDNNENENDSSVEEESQDSDIQHDDENYKPPPKKKQRTQSRLPTRPLAVQLRSSTMEKTKKTKEKIKQKQLAKVKRGSTRGRGGNSRGKSVSAAGKVSGGSSKVGTGQGKRGSTRAKGGNSRGRGRSQATRGRGGGKARGRRGRGKKSGHDSSSEDESSSSNGSASSGPRCRTTAKREKAKNKNKNKSKNSKMKLSTDNETETETEDKIDNDNEDASNHDDNDNKNDNENENENHNENEETSNHDGSDNTNDSEDNNSDSLHPENFKDNEEKIEIENETPGGDGSSQMSDEERTPSAGISLVPKIKGRRFRKSIRLEKSSDSCDGDDENDNQIIELDPSDPAYRISMFGRQEGAELARRRKEDKKRNNKNHKSHSKQNTRSTSTSKKSKSKPRSKATIKEPTSEYTASSDDEEAELDYTLGYEFADADEMAIEWIYKEVFDTIEEARKLTVFVSGTNNGVDPRTYSPLARTCLYGHRSGFACILQKGMWFSDELNDKTLDIRMGDIRIKAISNGNYTILTKFYLIVKRKECGQWKGKAPPTDENGDYVINYLKIDKHDLKKGSSYFNIPKFGGKTGSAESSGWKNLRDLPIFMGQLRIWFLDQNQTEDEEAEETMRRIGRELWVDNGRYAVQPIHVFNQLRDIKAQPSAIKHLTFMIYHVLLQIECGIVHLMQYGGFDYDTLTTNYDFPWAIFPTLIDPTIAAFRLATQKSKSYVFFDICVNNVSLMLVKIDI